MVCPDAACFHIDILLGWISIPRGQVDTVCLFHHPDTDLASFISCSIKVRVADCSSNPVEALREQYSRYLTQQHGRYVRACMFKRMGNVPEYTRSVSSHKLRKQFVVR